jgi:hypothetical protein
LACSSRRTNILIASEELISMNIGTIVSNVSWHSAERHHLEGDFAKDPSRSIRHNHPSVLSPHLSQVSFGRAIQILAKTSSAAFRKAPSVPMIAH